MAQTYGGIMSLTGEPEGVPVKAAVGVADVMTDMYASTAILAALRHTDKTGEGQHIDIALVDSQIAWLIAGMEADNIPGGCDQPWGGSAYILMMSTI